MFIGHDALGFGSKRLTPRVSLGWLIAAPLFLDLLWPVFLLVGIEHVEPQHGATPFLALRFTDYPWSHSLLMSAVWGIVYALVFRIATKQRGAVLMFLLVVSHWVLDWITHVPDLPLWPAGPKQGLGLWNHTAATVVIESLLFIAGVAAYVRTTRARDRIGSIAMWSFIAFLVLIYSANFFAPAPPPSAQAIGWTALACWLFPLWAAWFDRHREGFA